MQHALHRQCDRDGRGRHIATTGEWPDRRELNHDEPAHKPPRHCCFSDRVVAEGREHGAEHGEQAGPRARSCTAGPACSSTLLVPGHVIRWHGRPSSSSGRPPVRETVVRHPYLQPTFSRP